MDANRFDTFTKRLAGGRFSRRQAIRGFAATTAGVFLTITGRDRAGAFSCRDSGVLCGKDAHCCSEICDSDSHRCASGNSACAQFCQTVFPPGPDRGQCVSDGANGGGPCVACANDPSRYCGGACVDLENDPANCGGCGAVCGDHMTCDGGTCVCTADYTLCGSACIPSGQCCDNTSCNPGQTCINGACKDGQGTTCTDGSTCASNLCVDGVCCDRDCAGQCEACDVTGSVGTCTVVAGDPHGARPACAGSPPCGGACDGVTAGGCTYPGNDTSCGDPLCVDGDQNDFVCDGTGSCQPVATDCRLFVCRGGTCLASCANDDDCLGQAYCVSGTCTADLPNGSVCTAKDQCQSGFCVDGVCCDSACTGTCQACNLSGTEGTCTVVTAGEPPAGKSCAGAGTACAGTCDGTHGDCAYPGAGTSCGTPVCSDNSSRTHFCTGGGACGGVAVRDCSPYTCGDDGLCRDSCTDPATDCDKPGAICDDNGACVCPKDCGSSCAPADGCCTAADCGDDKCTSWTCAGHACFGLDKCTNFSFGCYEVVGCDPATGECIEHDNCPPGPGCTGPGTCDRASGQCTYPGGCPECQTCDAGSNTCTSVGDGVTCSGGTQHAPNLCCGGSCVAQGADQHCGQCAPCTGTCLTDVFGGFTCCPTGQICSAAPSGCCPDAAPKCCADGRCIAADASCCDDPS